MTNIPFKKPLAVLVAQGRKTQTRRRRYESDIVTYNNSGDVTKIERLDKNGRARTLYAVGMICPVQTDYRSKSPFSVEIVKLRPAVWNALSKDDAIAEGFNDAGEFLAYARGLYPTTFDPHGLCWAVTIMRHDMERARNNPTFYKVTADLCDWDYKTGRNGRDERVNLYRYEICDCIGGLVQYGGDCMESEQLAISAGNQALAQLIADYEPYNGDDE